MSWPPDVSLVSATREQLTADMMTVAIGPKRQRYVGVPSPDYLEKHGRPRHP
jgi:hypothetical protein